MTDLPSHMPRLSFWYEFASTYSYPAAMRVEERAATAGVAVLWRPFLLGPLFYAQQGMTDSPFNVVPVKGTHMWRDMARICRAEGLALRRPVPFPQNGLALARLAFAGQDEPWIGRFTRAVYEMAFVAGRQLDAPQTMDGLLTACGLDRDTWGARAQAAETKEAFRAQVQQAADLGLFGAPSFVVGREVFWGYDRMDAAIAAAAARAGRKM